MSISSNVRYLDDSGVFRVTLFPLSDLVPHEEFIQTHLEEVESGVIKDEEWTRPLIVCAFTKVILDGHHRHQIGMRKSLKYVPVVLVNYSSSEIAIYNGDSEKTMEYSLVLRTIDRGMLLPEKFTRHQFSSRLSGVKTCTCKVPMSALR